MTRAPEKPRRPRVAVICMLLTLSGCAVLQRLHQPPPAPAARTAGREAAVPPAPVPPPAPAKPRRPVRDAHDTKAEEKVAAIDPDTLIGLEPAAVERLLGAPSSVSKGDPSLVWTWNAPGCSFQVFFYPDLKTVSFHALKYGSTGGDIPDNPQACIRNILTARSNGPG